MGALASKASGEFTIVKALNVKNLSYTNTKEIKSQEVLVEVIHDKHAQGEQITIVNEIPENPAFAVIAEPNRDYLVSVENQKIFITDYYREPFVIGVVIAFFLLTLAIGGMKGLNAFISLILTGLSVFYILIPGIKLGYDPILLAIIVSGFSTGVTMLLIAGWTQKALAATLGTTGGVATAGLIAAYIIKAAPLSGLASTEAQILLANEIRNFDFQGMLVAGTIIASLGAAMDVAISIASAVKELHDTDPLQSSQQLLKHAMNIGRDIMGTMVNTLILAYAGSSIPLFLLLHNESGLRFLNMEIIATEIISSVVGSIGLLLAIPITAFIATVTIKRNSHG